MSSRACDVSRGVMLRLRRLSCSGRRAACASAV